MEELRFEKTSSSSGSCRSKKAKNGEKKIPQRGMGVAQLEKLRMEEHQKQQQQQQAESWVLPRNQHLIHRQMKAFQPPAFTIGGPSSHSLDLSSSHVGGLKDPIMSFAGLSLAPIHRRGMESVESSSCLTHVCMAPDSASVGIAAKETFQGLASEIYGAAVTQNEKGIYEPSLWPPGPPTELPMMNVSSCGTMHTEPPSNQNCSSNTAWPEEDTIPGRKRLWPFSQENSVQSKATRVEVLHPNSTGIFRNPLASVLEPVQTKPQWQTNFEMSLTTGKYLSDLNLSYDSGQGHTPKVSDSGQAIVKDSCSSTSTLQPGFQLNWKGSNENDIASQENETLSDFLSLGLFTSINDPFHGKSKEHSATSDGKHYATSDGCDEYRLSTHLRQETNAELGSPIAYQFGRLLQHGSSSTADDGSSIPFYKFLCHESNNKDIADSIYQGHKNKPADLDLRLSL